MKIHSDLRPFECEICQEKFKLKSILENHKVSHKEEKYTCPVCDRQMKYKHKLKNHLSTHDSNFMNDFPKEKQNYREYV